MIHMHRYIYMYLTEYTHTHTLQYTFIKLENIRIAKDWSYSSVGRALA